jgi:chemotaxis protein CheD
LKTVNTAEMFISHNPQEIIVAPSIGSGISVVVYDPGVRAGGILHFLLPDSTVTDQENAEQFPWAFADTGLPLFFEQAYAGGMRKSHLSIVLAGGAQTINPSGIMNFGERNFEAAAKILERMALPVRRADIGGHAARLVRLRVKDGIIQLEIRGQGTRML